MEENIKVYVQVDSNNVITQINSNIFIQDLTGWVNIDEGQGDKYSHAQGNYLDKSLIDMEGKYNYKLVNGEVVELTDEEKVNLDEIKKNKINEISSTCENKIINEFYSSCLGEKKRFDCTRDDQTYIMGLASKAQLILNNVATDNVLDWKASGEPICYTWQPQQALILGMDLFNHLTENKKRYEQLREYILTKLTTKDDINAVTWDTLIPTV